MLPSISAGAACSPSVTTAAAAAAAENRKLIFWGRNIIGLANESVCCAVKGKKQKTEYRREIRVDF